MAGVRRRINTAVWCACLLVAGMATLAASPKEKSDPLCPHIVACEYEAPAFSIRVVDRQTGQPLADVHAIATWLVYGGPPRRSVLMALEAVSSPDGWLAFPSWGPVRTDFEGVLPSRDPMISLFRPGYRASLIYNATPLDLSDTARVRAFDEAGETFQLLPFQGTAAETVIELRKAEDPFEGARMGQFGQKNILQAYLSRLRRVRDEAQRLPRDAPQVKQLLKVLDDDIRYFEAGGRP